jgi:hypothetical protein
MGETPFFLVYGAKTVILLEVTMVSPVFRDTTMPHRTSSDVMMSTLSMKEDGN